MSSHDSERLDRIEHRLGQVADLLEGIQGQLAKAGYNVALGLAGAVAGLILFDLLTTR